MYLTEQHVIHRTDPRFAAIDAAAFQSKNLYNASFNILRKRKPDAFPVGDAKGIAAYVVQPLRLVITV